VLEDAIAAGSSEQRLMLLLGAYAGLRLGEIARVHSDDLTAEGLRVVGNGGVTRVVPVHPRLRPELAKILGWAFPSSAQPGQHVGADYVHSRIRPLLGDHTVHSLRHRFASRAYAGTRDLRAVQTLFGHSKP
jgi:integrase